MKSTLADIKQLFNVKAIATAGLAPEAIPANTLGIVNVATGLTVVPANFAALPEKFRIISKMNGQVFYSFDDIEKSKLKNAIAKDYTAPVTNIWEAVIENCKCTEAVTLVINIDEASLMQRDGLTWTHADSIVEVSPAELKCFCNCDGQHKVYENNVLTMLLVNKINGSDSPFYSAKAGIDTTAAATGTTAPPSSAQTAGDMYIRTGSTSPGLYIYNGTAWELVGDITGTVTDLEAFVEANKAINTDEDDTNDGAMLKLIIEGKPVEASDYNDLDVNYIYPRGVRLTPSLRVDGSVMEFTETQDVVFEIGAGYDLRAEEWENMNHYTNLNYYPRLSDGIQAANLKYQFENGTNYNTVTFEFFTDKVERNNGDKRLFGVLLGTSVAGVYTSLKNMFGL